MPDRISFADWIAEYTQGVLEETKEDIYYGILSYSYDSIRYTTERELILYKTNDMSADTITINEGEDILLSATDNKHWIEVMSESGLCGWFYLEDNKVILPGGEEWREDLVPGL